MFVRFALIFVLLTLMSAYAAVLYQHLAARIFWGWMAVAFLVVSVAYVGNWPRMLLKNAAGGMPLYAWVLLWPFFGFVWLTYWPRTLRVRWATTEVLPGIFLSRRLLGREARAGSYAAVVDFACEFPRTPVAGAAYLSLPTLDGTPPTAADLRRGIAFIEAHLSRGPVLVHCAVGHGRSAMLVIAWMLAREPGMKVEEAVETVRRVRPGVRLKRGHYERLQEMVGERGESVVDREGDG